MRKYLLFFAFYIFSAVSAHACITPILEVPDEIERFYDQSGQPREGPLAAPPTEKQSILIVEFQRDKTYYDALVNDFCGVTPTPMPEKQREINQKIRDLLVKKWQKPEAAE